jgi:hypothetical protein
MVTPHSRIYNGLDFTEILKAVIEAALVTTVVRTAK